MPESSAESLDPTVLGEKVGDEGLPAEGFPADEPLAVDDPSILADGAIAEDDVESRDDRLNPEAGEDSARAVEQRSEVDGLIDTNVSPDGQDHEERLLADGGDSEDGPEAGAMHVESAPDRD